MENQSEIDRITGSIYLVRDLIRERLGLSFDDHDGIRSVANRLAARLEPAQCKSFLDYYYLLLSAGAASEAEWRYVIESLVRPKSGFWRHAGVVRTLVEVVLPELLSTPRDGPLRIWSACCSTGEEPLSIAMALNEAGLFDRAPIEIHASDANNVVIEQAIRGVYGEHRISQLDIQLRDRYFTPGPDGWRVAPELHNRIHWKVANLMIQDEVADLARANVIFCRNVFIYFAGHAICKTLRLLAQHMPAGAYLFSDSGEFFTTLVSSSKFFVPLNGGGSAVWIRQDVVT